MATITESNVWTVGVYQLEVTDPVQGGEGGVDNTPHKHLANRTVYLKAEVEKRSLLGHGHAIADVTELQAALDGKSSAGHVHDATGITSGVFDLARIPVLPSQKQVPSSGDLTALSTAQQAEIGQGTVVTTSDGYRWVYSGSGAKTAQASYVQLADITPDWSAIQNKPSVFTPETHVHPISEVTGLAAALSAMGAMMPSGVILPYGGTGTPAGYLRCDGSSVSRTAYSDLFAAIGTTYGTGDGSTTFSLPDFRGKFPLGASASHLAGVAGGAESVALTVDHLPSHSHGLNNGTGVVRWGSGGTNGMNLGDNSTTNGSAFSITVESTGNGQAVPILPPFQAVGGFIIKA